MQDGTLAGRGPGNVFPLQPIPSPNATLDKFRAALDQTLHPAKRGTSSCACPDACNIDGIRGLMFCIAMRRLIRKLLPAHDEKIAHNSLCSLWKAVCHVHHKGGLGTVKKETLSKNVYWIYHEDSKHLTLIARGDH